MTTEKLIKSLDVCINSEVDCAGCAFGETPNDRICVDCLLSVAKLHIEALVAERDAAIADIKRAWICATCKKREFGHEWLYCKHKCFVEQHDKTLTCDNFEWRGVMNNGCKQQTEGRTV